MSLLLTSCGYQYSDGARVGNLYKFSKKGFFCKSYEGILKTGYMTTNAKGIMTSEEFKFSVEAEDEVVILQLQQAMQMNQKVELGYVQKMFNPPCTYDSQYRIKSVKVVE